MSTMTPTELYKENPSRWSYASWVDPEKGFLYIETPKVACTKIKKELQLLCSLPIPGNLNDIHYRQPSEDYVRGLADFEENFNEIFNDKIFRFCFVRHPKARLISAYRDKIILSKGPFWEKYRRQIRNMHALGEGQHITFINFLEYVASIPDKKRDIHWRSQSELLRPEVFKYNFIGRQENFNHDFSHVLTKLGITNPEKYLQSRENVSHASNKEIQYLFSTGEAHETELADSPKVDELISEIYSPDFGLFGY